MAWQINPIDVGKRVKTARKVKDYRQGELAQKIGITKNYLSEIETGKKLPSTNVLGILCKELQISSDYILGINESLEHETLVEIDALSSLKLLVPELYDPMIHQCEEMAKCILEFTTDSKKGESD
jgi:transcriptional regulator with XRE-family HTH domain